ncbi:MAG: hypothetical protein QT08_C0023G0004 [archaeon GW2011_AR17]|nr:MAG: hypothetical protein QT08_C0023G0004 [archaeon GW2011_AR17]MBS3154240.1 DUF424 family protein [Candidatus Woesearchaeota archaeon]HIH14880.1 DUF424 family protein [Nanoarchaeota archaeon]HIH58862.1 DUF424 family protein [Nanoarchaeota archaeon]HII14049.1 DUF424 family protein [Nanoarchaeota archaeon]
MISVQFHENVVSLCDSELIGKTFEEGKHFLVVSEIFYRGEEMNKKKVIEVLKNAISINLVGKKTIAIALEEGFIQKKDIIHIQGVPHVQIYAF